MDGVLVDSEPLHGRAWTEVLAPLGVPLADLWYVEYVGIPDHTLADRMSGTHTLPLSRAQLLAQKRGIYQSLIPRELKAFPGVLDGVLRLNGVAKAIATSSCRSDVTRCLTATQLLDHFSVIVSGDDVSHHKPDPIPYLRAAELLGVAPAECIVVEDSPAGVASARSAGCTVVAVATAHPRESLAAADTIVSTTAEAMAHVQHALGV